MSIVYKGYKKVNKNPDELMCLSVHQFSLKVVGQSYIPHLRQDCKTVGFFLKIVFEESKRSVNSVRASRAGSARASYARRACVASLPSLVFHFKLLFNCSCVVCSWICKNTDCFAVELTAKDSCNLKVICFRRDSYNSLRIASPFVFFLIEEKKERFCLNRVRKRQD